MRAINMSSTNIKSNVAAPTQLLEAGDNRYAYRRFGTGSAQPLLFLRHFAGTLDDWDFEVTDPLAREREVILFDSAGVGRSSGKVSHTVAGMATHASSFPDALGLKTCNVLGYSLGRMIAQQTAQDRPVHLSEDDPRCYRAAGWRGYHTS
jgi:pimeloyl-ACP methyl ester carboxylesterase